MVFYFHFLPRELPSGRIRIQWNRMDGINDILVFNRPIYSIKTFWHLQILHFPRVDTEVFFTYLGDVILDLLAMFAEKNRRHENAEARRGKSQNVASSDLQSICDELKSQDLTFAHLRLGYVHQICALFQLAASEHCRGRVRMLNVTVSCARIDNVDFEQMCAKIKQLKLQVTTWTVFNIAFRPLNSHLYSPFSINTMKSFLFKFCRYKDSKEVFKSPAIFGKA